MTILVTGAFGQVGSSLLRKFEKSKKEIIVMDKQEKNEFSNIKKIITEITNIENLKKYKKELKDVTTLIHLASYITNDRDVIKSGPESVNLNIVGTINLLNYLPNLKKITFTSSYMVYGTPTKKNINENHPTNPNVVYGASKLATEKYLQIFCKENSIKLSILRMMGIYGVEKPHGQAIPTFIKLMSENKIPTINGTGKEKRNHLHIDDAVDSILASIKSNKSGVFNVGGKNNPSNLEIINIINKILKKNIKPEFKKSSISAYNFISDISKTEKDLKFKPKINIEEGIFRTIKQFENKGW